ncbi:hypothetical protein O3M35_006263 [Rhynocoris fuscipes]|uniref:methylated diphthine methylhydrolase n=1 Tax=Rhynocoris fuscipes TaxID=488301 RepID=A0AAW1DF80_9HEMI
MSSIEKITTFTTELNADTTEWCPIADYSDLFVCGTYQLNETEKTSKFNQESVQRIGYLYLFQICEENVGFIRLLQKLSMPGILDCKWFRMKIEEHIFLAVVNAVGELRILELLKNGNEPYLNEVQLIKVTTESNTLLLSLDCSCAITNNDVKIIVSNSAGEVTLISYKDGSFVVDDCWKLHQFEAWIVAFNYWNTNVFFSGGDDCKLHCFDIRVGRTTISNTTHTAGVTSMQMSPKQENTLVSGSYDEKILLWDIRNMKIPINSLDVGGGVWRLKWESKMGHEICASCMYFGSVVVNESNTEIIAEYKEHKSINYGIDWSLLSEEKIYQNLNIDKCEDFKCNLITVCSFYDNLLSLALVKIPKEST